MCAGEDLLGVGEGKWGLDMIDPIFPSSANPWERVQLLGAPHNLQFLETPGAKAIVLSKALTTLTQDSVRCRTDK